MAASLDKIKAAARLKLQHWKESPERCALEAFNFRLDDQQMRIVQAVVFGKCRKTAVKSGQKTGKTRVLGFLAWYWLLTRNQAQVYLTGPTSETIRDGTYKEMRLLHAQSPASFVKAQVPQMPTLPGTGFELPGFRRCVGIATEKVESLQGKSGENQLWLIDEASGFEEKFWSPVLGNLSGGGTLCVASNPTRPSGYFREIFAGTKGAFWNTETLRSDRTANYLQGRAVYPGLATVEGVEDIRSEFGENSSIYQIRVLGEFPGQGSDSIIAADWVRAALLRYESAPAIGVLEVGVDPARHGDDDSVVAVVRGARLLGLYPFSNLDGPQLAKEVLEIIRQHRAPNETPIVRIDANGVGASPYDSLKNVNGLLVIPVMSGASAVDHARFVNTRAELCFAVRNWLLAGGAIPADDQLEQELTCGTYSLIGSKIRVVSKDAIKAIIGRSPDRADALALAVYRPLTPQPRDLVPIIGASARHYGSIINL